MKNILIHFLMWLPLFSQAQVAFNPPTTTKKTVVDTLHGFLLTDNYRWLEDKTDPTVVAWTKAQHDFSVQYMNATQKSHPGLREDIAAYIDLDYEGPLSKEGKRIFQTIKKLSLIHI